MTTVVLVIRGIGYGLVLASFAAFLINLTNRGIVRDLLGAKAFSRDGAMTAADLRATGGVRRFALRDSSMLRKTVAATTLTEGEGEGEKRYFVPEEKATGAELRYVKRNSPVAWNVGIALLAAATEGAAFAIPRILSLFG